MANDPLAWRVLAVFCGPKAEHISGCGPVEEVASLGSPAVEVNLLRGRPLREVGEQILVWQPNLVYICGGNGRPAGTGSVPPLSWRTSELEGSSSGKDELPELFQGALIDTVYLDAPGCSQEAAAMRAFGVANVIHWPDGVPVPELRAAQFATSFFAALRISGCPISEAFAVAEHATSAQCSGSLTAGQIPTLLPVLASLTAPSLPGMDSIPVPVMEGVKHEDGVVHGVPGWQDVRLLAPLAELRLLVCGQSSLIDTQRLSWLGEALRALLVLEMRRLDVESLEPCSRMPAHLEQGCSAVQCRLRSASAASVSVLLGGPESVLGNENLALLALRSTLVADALSLQFKLPPAGALPPSSESAANVAGGAPVMEAFVITSVWAVTVLRALAQDTQFRGLVSLGIAAVGSCPVAAYTAADCAHYTALHTQPGRGPPATKKHLANIVLSRNHTQAMQGSRALHEAGLGDSERSGSGAWGLEDEYGNDGRGQRKGRKRSRLAVDDYPEPDATFIQSDIPYNSTRPSSLQECSEQDFLEDLCLFWSSRKGTRLTVDTFLDTVLNGVRLDVWNLYKEVCQRGGFTIGNGINWKGQIFPKMRNFTNSHKITGIGSTLKTKYQQYLADYEQAHPEDVAQDTCALCGAGGEAGSDWISCDRCDTWVHYSCDPRPGLEPFKEYAKTDGMPYVCVGCDPDGQEG